MIKNGAFYLLISQFLIVLAFTKCKENSEGRWTCYHFFQNDVGKNLICVATDDTLKNINLHWFINLGAGFCHMEFLDTISDLKNDNLSINTSSFEKNSLKIIPDNELKFPLDQNPNFSFNRSTKTLRFYDDILEEYELKNDDYINDLIEKQNNWDYKPFSF